MDIAQNNHFEAVKTLYRAEEESQTDWMDLQYQNHCRAEGGGENNPNFTPCSLIGRIKKRLESYLHYECFVTTNVSKLPGRPVGMGAIVHCSLASHMTDCVIQHPEASRPEISPQEWTEATDGRIQCLKVTRPGSPYTWKFVGVYQHVASLRSTKSEKSILAAQHPT
jgi:hypothetical protein